MAKARFDGQQFIRIILDVNLETKLYVNCMAEERRPDNTTSQNKIIDKIIRCETGSDWFVLHICIYRCYSFMKTLMLRIY